MNKFMLCAVLTVMLVGCSKAEPTTVNTTAQVAAVEKAQQLSEEVINLTEQLAAHDAAVAKQADRYVDVDPALWSQIPDNSAQAEASKSMAKEHIDTGTGWDYLPVKQLQADGYPVFTSVACDFNALPNGSLCELDNGESVDEYWVSLHTTVVDNRDFFRKDWICGRVCFDNEGHLVGSVGEDMVSWVTAQCDWSIYTAPDCSTTRKKS